MRVMSTQCVPFLTPEQYLEIERAAETRGEYLAGSMYAMAGATRNHARLVQAFSVLLYSQLRGRECEASSISVCMFPNAALLPIPTCS
jgi:Uma2 family endonuclease